MPQEDHTEEPLKAGMNYGMRQSKRYVTTHDASGKSVFTSVPALLYRERTGYALARTYALSSVPTRLTAHEDLKSYLSDDGEQNATSYTRAGKDITIEGGVSMTCLDMGPGAKSVMHRTVSIDFAIVTEGQVELELDSGEKVVLYSGDTVVQRATMHRWRNLSDDKPARFVGITFSSDRIEVGGRMIEQTYLLE